METMNRLKEVPGLDRLRLVATDLDGTLLRSDKTVSARTGEILSHLKELGITLVLVSARPPRSLRMFAQQAHIGGLAISCNGAITYDLDQDQILLEHTLTAEQVTFLIERMRAELPELIFAGEDGQETSCEAAFLAFAPSDATPPRVADLTSICAAPHAKLLVAHPTLGAGELYERFFPLLDSELYSITYSGGNFVEIALSVARKGIALAELCAGLNIAPHEVIAFGDMPNDLPMLDWAGFGVAVANAHPLVLQTADASTLSNDEDGVAHFLERLLIGDPTSYVGAD